MMKTRILLAAVMTMIIMTGQAQVSDDIYPATSNDNVNLTIVTPAKPDKATKKERKAKEKKLRQRVDSLGHTKAARALERGYWVIQAERINVGYTGYTVSGLNGNSNFIFQQAGEGMVQFAFNHGGPSPNGMGGMTLAGKVSNTEMKTDKKGNIRYTYTLVGEDINAQVDVTVYSGSDYAQAIVTPTFSGPQFTLHGRLVPYIRPRQ